MNRYLKLNDWSIVESRWDPENQLKSESIFSIGNGRMGQRANFEEDYSGESLQGTYLAGIYYPDKTKVGWWKNGYPEYFAKVLNAPNWIGIRVESAGETLDLAKVKVSEFHRELNMREGYLQRRFIATFPTGKQLAVDATRFCSLTHDETGAIRYAVTPLNFSGKVTMTPYLDADVQNSDSNYEEKFWEGRGEGNEAEVAWVQAETRKSAFHTVSAMCFKTYLNNQPLQVEASTISRHKYIEQSFTLDVQQNETVVLEKYAANLTSENHAVEDLVSHAIAEVRKVAAIGYDNLKAAQKQAWARRWEDGDIRIEGDSAAQQGIRFNIFQLHQTYTGEDQRLNIGPKGFTGEKYGGSTYWDTEAYCFPFYLNTAGKEVARNLLIYRHKHLQKAIENAEKLGFKNGAALYPMVTINGEECHNEWEITFEEIHRNGAIAFAIYNYVRHSDDSAYLAEFGFDVLLGISRFWAQRITWSEQRQAYVMLGVTGPNEYENNVNNNWYTNLIARWTLEYTLETIEFLKKEFPNRYEELKGQWNFDEAKETAHWSGIIENIHLPQKDESRVFLQQDGFLDKEQLLVADLDPKERPINQHWSWDRILRSVFIKQADVLQGIYFLEDRFDMDTIRENFDFYEPRTVHESSLSPCVHVVLAARLGRAKKAYDLYLRTSRLDLDDYNREVHQGLHITSMAGTWLSIVEGFGGQRVKDGYLHFRPTIPEQWTSYQFKVLFRDRSLELSVNQQEVTVKQLSGEPIGLYLMDNPVKLAIGKSVTLSLSEDVSV